LTNLSQFCNIQATIKDYAQGGRVGLSTRLRIGCTIVIWIIAFSVALAGAQGKIGDDTDMLGLVNVQECEGVKLTQCEAAKNLIFTLKMGEDLTCESCFVQLRALGIAPGEDWSYADPNTVITVEEIKGMVLEIHRAYNRGMVRLDGFEVAAAVNRFCRDIKGPAAVPVPREKEKKEPEMTPVPPPQEPKDRGPTSSEEAGKKENETPFSTQESGTQKEEGK
jgi:hypothetical protein